MLLPLLLPLSTRSAGAVPGPAGRSPLMLVFVGVVTLVDHPDGVDVVRGVVD